MLRQVLAMFAVAALISVAVRPFQDKTIPYWGFPQPLKLLEVTDAFAAEMSSPDSVFVPAETAYKVNLAVTSGLWMKRKKENVHFVDAREPDLYKEGHIPGSVNIPWEHAAEYETQINAIPKTDLVLIYCDGGDCHLSHDLSEHMNQQGWKRIAVFEGGWAEWSAEMDAIETGEPAKQ